MQRKEPRPRGASCSGRSAGPRRAVASPLVDEHVHEGDLQPASARGPSFRHGLGRRRTTAAAESMRWEERREKIRQVSG